MSVTTILAIVLIGLIAFQLVMGLLRTFFAYRSARLIQEEMSKSIQESEEKVKQILVEMEQTKKAINDSLIALSEAQENESSKKD